MMILWILGGVLCFLLLLLLIPIRYTIGIKPWMLSCRVSVLIGLYHKTFTFEKEKEEIGEEDSVDSMAELLAKAEAYQKAEETVPPEEKEKPPSSVDGLQKKFWDGEEDLEEDSHPSWMAQLRWALDNGLLEKVFHAAMKLLAHSFPGHWRVEGEFGTGDPMDTGVISGMTAAFFSVETQGIRWNYLERVVRLEGNGQGRIIPIYAIYIALRLVASKEARDFWHFRQGGTQHG